MPFLKEGRAHRYRRQIMGNANDRTCEVDAVYVPVDTDGNGNDVTTLRFVNIVALGDRSAGARIHFHRRQKGWSRMDLARRAKIDLDSVRLAEQRPEMTPVGVFLKICDALHLSVYDLSDEDAVSIDADGV
jgi:hypothetical protein